MFFTRVGKILAHIGFWLGLLRVGMGFLVASGALTFATGADPCEAERRYLGTETSGQTIDQGVAMIVVAVALGVLCEISARVNAKS